MYGLLCRSIFVCSLNNFHLGAKMPLEFGYMVSLLRECIFFYFFFFLLEWTEMDLFNHKPRRVFVWPLKR